VVVAKTSEDRSERLQLASLCIPSSRVAQFNDRRLTAGDIAGFKARNSSTKLNTGASSLSLLSVPIKSANSSLRIQSKSGTLFEGIAFIVT
jgi:hypothetical protein